MPLELGDKVSIPADHGDGVITIECGTRSQQYYVLRYENLSKSSFCPLDCWYIT